MPGPVVKESGSGQPHAAAPGNRSARDTHKAESLKALLTSARVIPAVRSYGDAEKAAACAGSVVYLLGAALSTLDQYMYLLRDGGKEVMVNLDLFAGLGRDAEAVAFLARSGVAGVISTHTDVLQAAVANGLFAIQRTFLLDSGSVESSMRSLRRFVPDALELLPGPVAPRMLPRLRHTHAQVATIAGGLIQDMEEANRIVEAGIDAVSTSNPGMWKLPRT